MTRLKSKFLDTNQDATKIGDGSVNTSEYQYIDTLTSNAQTQLDGKASVSLANLTTTAINVDLTFNKANAIVSTPNTATGTENLSFKTGDSSAVAASGNIVVSSGEGFASGSIRIQSGNISGNGNTSGGMFIGTGDSSQGASGDITITTGIPDGTGYQSGLLNLSTSPGAIAGSINISAGQSLSSGQDGPTVTISAGPAASDANGGSISLAAGTGQGTGHDGDLLINSRKFLIPYTQTSPGNTGNQTINSMSGTVNCAAGVDTIAVTNDRVTLDSIVFAVIRTSDLTAIIMNVVPDTGSFTITLVAPTAEVSIGWWVIN